MLKFLGGRLASVAAGLLLLGIGSVANAQDMSAIGNVSAAVKAVAIDSAVKPLADKTSSPLVQPVAAVAALATTPASHPLASIAKSVATEAAWLYKGGWPLSALVAKFSAGAALDEQTNCLATAVYFEARGESLEGQLAVARVVMNRAASGRYPSDWCSVVKQHAQFSFVRHGEFPAVDTASGAWARAEGVTRLAVANVVPSIEPDVLWYHANYVAPSWRQRLSMVEKIGAHIFYRA